MIDVFPSPTHPHTPHTPLVRVLVDQSRSSPSSLSLSDEEAWSCTKGLGPVGLSTSDRGSFLT